MQANDPISPIKHTNTTTQIPVLHAPHPHLLMLLFDDQQRHSLPNRLRELEARFQACPTGVVEDHSLVGLCASFGLAETLTKLNAFHEAPSEDGMLALWKLVEEKRRRIQSGAPISQIRDATGQRPIRDFIRTVSPHTNTSATSAQNDPLHVIGACSTPIDCSKHIKISPFFGDNTRYQTTHTHTPIVCLGIDDDPFIRSGHALVFARLGATKSRSLGATREEQVAFVDVAMGLLDMQLNPIESGRQADVLLVDQHIELHDKPHLLGTAVVTELHRRGFNGVIVVVSGARDPNLTKLRTCPGVDMVADKSVLSSRGFVTKIQDALAAKRSEQIT